MHKQITLIEASYGQTPYLPNLAKLLLLVSATAMSQAGF